MRGPRRDPRPSCFDKYIDKCNAAPATRKSVSGQRGGTLADTPTITNAVSFSFFFFPPPSSTSSVSCSNLEDKKCWEVTTQINTDFRVLLIRLEPFYVSSGRTLATSPERSTFLQNHRLKLKRLLNATTLCLSSFWV